MDFFDDFQFWGFAGSSVVYQSTRIVPSAVLVGAIAIDLVFSTARFCSTSKRSRVYGFVDVLVSSRWIEEPFVRERIIASSSAAVLIVCRWNGLGSWGSSMSSLSFLEVAEASLSEA